jgi:hypothetical protein
MSLLRVYSHDIYSHHGIYLTFFETTCKHETLARVNWSTGHNSRLCLNNSNLIFDLLIWTMNVFFPKLYITKHDYKLSPSIYFYTHQIDQNIHVEFTYTVIPHYNYLWYKHIYKWWYLQVVHDFTIFNTCVLGPFGLLYCSSHTVFIN